MKRLIVVFFFLSWLLTACVSGEVPVEVEAEGPGASAPLLTITHGALEVGYTIEDLKALPSAQAAFKGVTYVGVPMAALLEDAGVDLEAIQAVKASAQDGFSANLEKELVLLEDSLVAYARLDGSLAADEMPLRLVLPDQPGSLNVRMLVTLQIIQ